GAIGHGDGELPTPVQLDQNVPDPGNPATAIRFALGGPHDVELAVYDVLGRRVATLVNEHLAAGTYEVDWDTRTGFELASGMYIYTLRAGDFVESRQMVLTK